MRLSHVDQNTAEAFVAKRKDDPTFLLQEAWHLVEKAARIREDRGEAVTELVPMSVLISWTKGELASRHDRATFFQSPNLADPYWDAYLLFFVADDEGWQPTLAQISEFSQCTEKTSQRYVDILVQKGFAQAEASTLPRLTRKGRDILVRYMTRKYFYMASPPEPIEYLSSSNS